MYYTETLPEFIGHHTVMKLCLPCKLVLPVRKCGTPTQNEPEENGISAMEAIQGKSPEERRAVEKISTQNNLEQNNNVIANVQAKPEENMEGGGE